MEKMTDSSDLRAQAMEFEVLAHELRLYILEHIKEQKAVAWTQLQTALEQYMNKRLNPNSINFHLTKLVGAGFIKKERTGGGEQKYVLTEKGKKVALAQK